jgi:hypothetical protein
MESASVSIPSFDAGYIRMIGLRDHRGAEASIRHLHPPDECTSASGPIGKAAVSRHDKQIHERRDAHRRVEAKVGRNDSRIRSGQTVGERPGQVSAFGGHLCPQQALARRPGTAQTILSPLS